MRKNNLLKYLNNLPKETLNLIKWVGRQADKLNLNAYLVGGFVRDILLGKKNLDIDIVIEGDALDFAKSIVKRTKGNLTMHKKFGTANILTPNHTKIDIATARKEIYEYPGALPKVLPGLLRDDLFRRDFTINALAIKINKSNFAQLIDFFGSYDDIKAKRIRVLHDLSFIDDPTRIFRAIRFKERFGFSLEAHTYNLIKEAVKKDAIYSVKPPRIFKEIEYLLNEPKARNSIISINKICKWSSIDPSIKIDGKTLKLLTLLDKEIKRFDTIFKYKYYLNKWLVYFMLLLEGVEFRDVKKILEKFNLRREDRKRIISCKQINSNLFEKLDSSGIKPSSVYRILAPLSIEEILLLKIKTNKSILKRNIDNFLKKHKETKLNINGMDLKKLGIEPSKKFGSILKKALYKKIDGYLLSTQEEIDFVKSLSKIQER